MNTFSQRLKYFRLKAGYSQKELADLIGISVSTYNNYETRNYEPKIEILVELAYALSIDVNLLVGFIPKLTKSNEMQYAKKVLNNFEENGDVISYTYLLTLDVENSPILNEVESHAYKDHKLIINLTKDEFLRFVKHSFNLARNVAQEESEQKRDEYFRSIINRMIFAHYLEYDYLQQQKK